MPLVGFQPVVRLQQDRAVVPLLDATSRLRNSIGLKGTCMTLSNGDFPGTLSCPDLGAGARDRQGRVSGHAAQQFRHACTASKPAVGKSAAAIVRRCRGHGDDRRLPQVSASARRSPSSRSGTSFVPPATRRHCGGCGLGQPAPFLRTASHDMPRATALAQTRHSSQATGDAALAGPGGPARIRSPLTSDVATRWAGNCSPPLAKREKETTQ